MIKRRPLETHPIVGQRLHERDERCPIPRIDANASDVLIEARVRNVPLPNVEVHDLRERSRSAGVEIRACQFHVSQAGRLEDACRDVGANRGKERHTETIAPAAPDVVTGRAHAGANESEIAWSLTAVLLSHGGDASRREFGSLMTPVTPPLSLERA
jgi:hypothetical protein